MSNDLNKEGVEKAARAYKKANDDYYAERRGSFDELIKIEQAKRVKFMEAAIRAYKECEGWRDIESAPKDGRSILLINGSEGGYGGYAGQSSEPYHIGVGYWEEGEFLATDCCDGVSTFKPTHWQPLPTPPTKESK